jgi:hypothetical protein
MSGTARSEGASPAGSGRSGVPAVLFLVFAIAVLGAYFLSPLRSAALSALELPFPVSVCGIGLVLAAGAGLSALAARRQALCGAALTAGATLLALLLLGLAVPGVRARTIEIVLAALQTAASIGLGCRLLARLRFRPAGAAEEAALGGALGLLAFSTVFFLLGQVGLFRGWALASVVLAALAFGARDLVRLTGRLADGAGRTLRGAGWLGCALLAATAAIHAGRLAHCFSPATPGHSDYDALSYHLPVPAEWLASGFVSFLPHNAYGNMPAAAELLFAPGLALAPERWGGLHFSRLVGLACAELAALAVFAAARRLAGRRAALLAALVFLGGAWLSEITVNPYVEPVLTLFVAATGLALLAALGRRRFDLGRLATAGLLAGAACCTKYPALVLLALPAALLAAAGGTLRHVGFRRALAGGALVGTLALAAAAPWYLRNLVASGNPVYPLAGRVLASRYWDEHKERRWSAEHRPRTRPVSAVVTAFWGRPRAGLENLLLGPLPLIFLPIAAVAVIRRRRRGALWPALLAAAFICGWAALTHQIDRFLYPVMGLLAVLIGAGAAEAGGRRRNSWAVVTGVALLAVLAAAPGHWAWMRQIRGHPAPAALLGLAGDEDARAGQPEMLRDFWRSVGAVNALPAGSRVLLAGESRAALFTVPVAYSSVWDTSPLEEVLAGTASDADPDTTAAAAAERLRGRGITHVFWSWPEIFRLRKSYGRPELSPEQIRALAGLEKGALQPIRAWGQEAAANPLTGRPVRAWELWELAPKQTGR